MTHKNFGHQSSSWPNHLLLVVGTCLILTQNLAPLGQAEGLKILSISFMSSPSHKIVYTPLLEKLADLGHEVTVVGPIRTKTEVKNLKNVYTTPMEELMGKDGVGHMNFFDMKAMEAGILGKIISKIPILYIIMGSLMDHICRVNYELPQVKAILEEKFDLVVFTPFFNDCLYGLVHSLNVPTVLISQVTVFPWMAATFGTPTLPSFTPLAFFGYGDKMNFGERLINFAGIIFNDLVKSYFYNPNMEKIYREFVNPNLPGIKEIEANASIILCNSHISFTPPKPLMPDIIDVGGMHLKAAKPVPKDLDDFFNGAGEHGFILFSMGSALQGHEMGEEKRKIFLNTFAKLKQRVIWKWETEMNDLPPNVRISKWLPQQDVLGHKNLRMFITHGGHGSTTEALWNGVPLLGIPMLGDQPYNMEQASRLGFAHAIDFNQLSEEYLLEGINKVLNDPSYTQRVKKLSELYHDQIDNPLDRAVYWIEYTARHQGARHLRSAARDLSTIQYYSLDVIATLGAILLIMAYVNFVVLRAIFRKCFGGKKGGKKETGLKAKKIQ